MVRACGLALLAASQIFCGPSYRTLKVDKIDSVSLTVEDQEQRFCAYRPVALRAVVTYQNGKQAHSRAPGEGSRGRLRTSEFQWLANHGTVDANAVLMLPHTPLDWFDEAIRVSARVVARPEVVAETTLHPRFDCGATLDLRGAEGARGGEAEDGGPGERGPDVDVALAYIDTERSGRLVLVRVQRGDEPPEHFLIDAEPSAAPLVIDARGGDGGAGGQGVAGVDGRSGLDGADGLDGAECADGGPGQDGTGGEPGGPGGPGAHGGRGGDGGHVVVRYDARFPELADRVEVRVEGGAAGAAGPGGAGGRGGRGGTGGAGGKAGPAVPDSRGVVPDCEVVDGPEGAGGAAGATGPRGPDGQPGTSGAPGELRASAAEVAELFTGEIQRGIPIVLGTGAE